MRASPAVGKTRIRLLLFALLSLGVSLPAKAQFVAVSATVLDPTGAPYVNCKGSADFVPSPSATLAPTINGSTFQTSVVIAACDSFGNFTLGLVDNNLVTDGHSSPPASQWNFGIRSQDEKTAFNCKITITGVSQNITAALQACAAPLQPSGGGGGNFTVKNIPCASSMTFTMAGVSPNTGNTAFVVNPLNCNVTSSVVTPSAGGTLQKGAVAQFTLIQNATGGFSFAWPANFIDKPTIQSGSLATTNASFWYDGTNWHAQTFPASGGGGGSPAGNQGTIQSTNGTAFSASNLSEPPSGSLSGSFKVGEDMGACGPNPYVDIRCFGARAHNPNTTPAAVGITATCTSGQTTCTISSVSDFINGDGVIIYGAGATNSLTTPAAPTVTPIVATAPVNTLLTTADRGAGATTYNYYTLKRDRNGGTTTLSPIGTTTTGQASLGPQTVNITSMTRSGQTVTVTTASAHNIVTGAEVYIGGGNSLSDITFYGWFGVVSAADNTHFTFASGPSTALGATTSATGGTASWFQGNKVLIAAPADNTVYEAVYSDRQSAGTCALIGVMNAIGSGSDLEFDDWGQTFTANQVFPAIFPTSFTCASPPAATSDSLSTTIASGAGTTTLTLANTVGTSVSGATIRLDAAPAIVAAASQIQSQGNGGSLTIPVDPGANPFVVNSWVNLTSTNLAVLQEGKLYLNDTIELACPSGQGCGKWEGDTLPQHHSAGSNVGWGAVPAISINAAHPALFLSGAPQGTRLRNFALSGVPVNGSLGVLSEAGQNIRLEGIDCAPGSGGNDFLSSCFMFRTNPGNSDPGNIVLNFVGMSPGGGNAPDSGGSNSPVLNCRQCANVDIQHAYLVHRGMYYGSRGGQMQVGVGGTVYINGGFTPLVTMNNAVSTVGIAATIGNIVLDTISHPCIASISGAASALQSTINLGAGCNPSSSVLPVTGSYGVLTNAGFQPTFASSFGNAESFAVDGTLFTGAANFPYPISLNNAALATGTNYPIFINPAPMAAPTCSVSAGGSVAVDAGYKFQLVPVWQNGGLSQLSGSSTSCATTSGNQTVTVNWSAAPGSPADYRIYVNSASHGSGYLNVTGLAGTTSYAWSSVGINTGSFPNIPAGGPTMMMSGIKGMTAPSFTFTGGGFSSVMSGTFTANRTLTLPDASGTVAVSATAPITLSAAGAIACPNCFNLSTNNVLGQHYFDIGTQANPGNPATGSIRVYADSSSGNLTCLTSAGANCIPGGGGGTPGGSNTQVQFNSSGSFAGSANLTWVSPALHIGVDATATGILNLSNGGVSGATVSIQNQVATTPYNFNLPPTAGTSGQPLLSGGGGSNSMSFGTLGYSGGGTNATSFTANQLVSTGASAFASVAGSTVGTNPILKLQPALAANTALILDTAATPTGDILDINVNGTKTSWFDSSGFLHAPQATYTGTGPLLLSGSAGSCTGALSGTAVICLMDAATNMALLSDNGGSFKPIAQFSNASPAAHGVGLAGVTAPQVNFSSPGTTGQPFISGGSAADGAYGALNLAGGSTIVTGVLPTANGGTGASSLSGANIITVTGAVTVGHCAQFQASTVIQDSGSACGGGASPARLDQITAATANVTGIANANFSIRWNWALTGSTTGFIFGESAASTGSSNILLQATTASASTAVPFQTDNNGAGWQLSSAGVWKVVGGGALDASGITVSNGFKVQVAAGCTSGADGAECYDSTNKNQHVRTNGADSIVGAFAAIPTTADLVDTSVASSNTLLHDSGIATANVVTQTSNAASNQICAYTGANKVCVPTTTLPTAAFPALTGDVTNSAGSLATTISANAVTASKSAVVLTRRVCDIAVGDTSGSAITNAQLGPQKRICYVPAASTIVEMDVAADGGTPNVIVAVDHAGTNSNIVSSALATASSGGIACSNTGGTTGIDGATTCSSTLQNTSVAAGDYLELVSGTAGGTAKFMTIHVVYTVN